MAEKQRYKLNTGLSYKGDTRNPQAGDVVDDVPPGDVAFLLERGDIEKTDAPLREASAAPTKKRKE